MEYQKKDELLQVYHLSFSYGDKQVLDDIHLKIFDIVRPGVTQGQVVALVGQSGCGKSTLFNIMAGLLQPAKHKGCVKIKDYRADLFNPTYLRFVKAGDMGVVYQNYYLYNWRKVNTILKFAARKNPAVKAGHINRHIHDIVGEFNLQDHLDKYPSQLSGGQQQRVAIAEQILNGSNFLLLDEPFSGLDMLMLEKVSQMLVKVSQLHEEKTIIIVSHDIASAVAIADTVFVMKKMENGAKIVKEIDLIERGLAWQPNVRELPVFKEVMSEIKSLL